jgi:hypothetical protein
VAEDDFSEEAAGVADGTPSSLLAKAVLDMAGMKTLVSPLGRVRVVRIVWYSAAPPHEASPTDRSRRAPLSPVAMRLTCSLSRERRSELTCFSESMRRWPMVAITRSHRSGGNDWCIKDLRTQRDGCLTFQAS